MAPYQCISNVLSFARPRPILSPRQRGWLEIATALPRWFSVSRVRLWRLRHRLRRSPAPPFPDPSTEPIGLALITYNRPAYLTRCLASLTRHRWGQAAVRLVVDDGSDNPACREKLDQCAQQGIAVLRHPQNRGVAAAKNAALRHLMQAGCQHLFLLEDDLMLNSDDALVQYAHWGRETGLRHLNYALHGPKNLAREMIINNHGQWLLCYPQLVGAFSYYHRRAIEDVGYLDERFHNAYEHVEHTYRIALAGHTLPFWYFADHPLNCDLVAEQPGAPRNSIIRQGDTEHLVNEARKYWVAKHGSWLPPRPR